MSQTGRPVVKSSVRRAMVTYRSGKAGLND